MKRSRSEVVGSGKMDVCQVIDDTVVGGEMLYRIVEWGGKWYVGLELRGWCFGLGGAGGVMGASCGNGSGWGWMEW